MTGRVAQVAREPVRTSVFRIANPGDGPFSDFLVSAGLDASQCDEVLELLRSTGDMTEELLLDGPFKRKFMLAGTRTRYSDGTFAVLYASMEVATARGERVHWTEAAHESSVARSYHYVQFECTLEGEACDLVPFRESWPDLTDPNDYTFCNTLGAEAVSLELDALKVPSARVAAGRNAPVFDRTAVSDPRQLVAVTITTGPDVLTTVQEG